MENDGKAVVRYRDGRVERASVTTIDAAAQHIVITSEGDSRNVPFGELKAIFFPQHAPAELVAPAEGSRVRVEFADGEQIRGTAAYNPAAPGLFLFPDDRSKNDRIYVVTSAVVAIEIEKL